MKISTIWEFSELRWSIDEMESPNQAKKAAKLMRLVKSGKPFDIGWVGLKKEIVSFNIRRDKKGEGVQVSVCASMDDLPYDLITDADETMTYDQIDEMLEDDEFSSRVLSIDTETMEIDILGSNPSLEEISSALMRLWGDADTHLENGFKELKRILEDYKRATSKNVRGKKRKG